MTGLEKRSAMTNKLFITGASSYLAHRLISIASEYGEVVGVARSARSVVQPAKAIALDLTDQLAIEKNIEEVHPTAIIHAAAVNPGAGDALMNAVNHEASALLASIAARLGVRFVMVSSESVYSGNDAPYTDDSPADPINLYGKSKAAGEQAVLAINPAAAIVRTSLIYGLEMMDRGTEGFVERLAKGEPLVLFDDVLRQPIWVDDLSHALCKLATEFTHTRGTLNVVGDEVMSRAEFGLAMLKHWGIETSGNVTLKSGKAFEGVQMDLRCRCDVAKSLGLSLSGVSEVLKKAT
ncbi:NAD-dependent epimerase/dehydratase family protein [Leucothrix sargassi]|nr:NAD-dependent epimerase/dehydratase family protein [Leucothrix sargassi]